MNRLLVLAILTGTAWAQSTLPLTSSVDHPISPGTGSTPVAHGADEVEADKLGELPPVPGGKASLIGGTIRHLDPVRDKLIIQVFGGGSSAVLFDARTRVFLNAQPASLHNLNEGQRIYAETVLDQADVFARSIHIATQVASGQSSGQVLDYNAKLGTLVIRDALLPKPVKLRLDSGTSIRNGEHAVDVAELRPGTLVSVGFVTAEGPEPIARQISILAQPGASFVFAGRVADLDLHTHLLVVVDPRNNRNYEVYCDPATVAVPADLREGTSVTVNANFDGTHYSAVTIKLEPRTTK